MEMEYSSEENRNTNKNCSEKYERTEFGWRTLFPPLQTKHFIINNRLT